MSQIASDQNLQFIDTHCHLDMENYENDRDKVIDRALQAGISKIITIGIDAASSQRAVRLAEKYPSVYAAIGVHPHDAAQVTKNDFKIIERLALHKKVVGYGEIGLDYAKLYSAKDIQQQVFSRQLSMAKELGLPVIIHDRDAHNDTLRILKQHFPFPAGGVMHCFSGDIAFADKVMELGFFISIPGIVTFKNATSLQQVACVMPLQSMLMETDGPFLAPVPYRGKRNVPEFLLHTARKIAELRKTTLTEIAETTTANANTLFPLMKSQTANDL
jgi:TatD DNase family protein